MLIVAIPSLSHVPVQFAMSLARLTSRLGWDHIPHGVLNRRGDPTPLARNLLVQFAKQHEAKEILWLDSDMTFPPDAYHRLKKHDKPIAGTVYYKRTPPHTVVGAADQPGDYHTGLIPMKMLGFGCVLTQMWVFESLKGPHWFQYPIVGDMQPSEDVHFAATCATAKIPMFADLDLSRELGHISSELEVTEEYVSGLK